LVELGMRNDPEARDVPDLLLEQYRLNELTQEDVNRVRRALDSDADLPERLRKLESSDAEIARTYPPVWLAERIRERHVGGPGRARVERRWVLRIGLAAAVATIAFTVPVLVPRAGRAIGDAVATWTGEDRLKGLSPSLLIYRRTNQGSETLADGGSVRPGDVVRLGYAPADRAYGVILSIDTRGTVTRHLPREGNQAAVLAHDRVNLLDSAFELDDVPGWERFYFITSRTAFDVEHIVSAVRRAGASANDTGRKALPLPSEFDQFVFVLQKEVKP
jgi:hypothetical protein